MSEPRSKAILEHARHLRDQADQKLARLRQIEPLLLDISLREASVGSRAGQTLAEKLEILPRLRAFGFTNIILGTLNYPGPDELEVDDDFMMYLRDQQADLTGCFALTSVGASRSSGEFSPGPSLLKLNAYGVPNTVLEIHLSQAGMPPLYDLEALSRSLPASIRWLHDNVRSGRPRIISFDTQRAILARLIADGMVLGFRKQPVHRTLAVGLAQPCAVGLRFVRIHTHRPRPLHLDQLEDRPQIVIVQTRRATWDPEGRMFHVAKPAPRPSIR
jgi:hypothetical protein